MRNIHTQVITHFMVTVHLGRGDRAILPIKSSPGTSMYDDNWITAALGAFQDVACECGCRKSVKVEIQP